MVYARITGENWWSKSVSCVLAWWLVIQYDHLQHDSAQQREPGP